MSSSDYQKLLVLGATGYTGRLAVKYLIGHPSFSKVSLQLAARSVPKLHKLVSEFDVKGKVTTLEVHVDRYEQLEAAVKGADVVLNAVGPFFKLGPPVVRACAENRVHYVDFTGETLFIHKLIAEYDYLAYKTHTIIIPSCAYDSIPSDVSAYLSVQTLKRHLGPKATAKSSTSAHEVYGGLSGGSIHTALELFELPSEKLRLASQPYILSPMKGRAPSGPRVVWTLPHIVPEVVGGFFPMSGSNSQIVQRTWGLLQMRAPEDQAYGENFVYDEFAKTSSLLAAIALSLFQYVLFGLLIFVPPFRSLFKEWIPSPGEGPSDDAVDEGYVKVTNVTSSDSDASGAQTHIKSIFRGIGDPYFLSAVMASESALALLPGNVSKLSPLAREGGVLTPVSALGDVLVERLKESGRFKFESEVIGQGKVNEDVKKR